MNTQEVTLPLSEALYLQAQADSPGNAAIVD